MKRQKHQFFSYRDIKISKTTDERNELLEIEVEIVNIKYMSVSAYEDGPVQGITAKSIPLRDNKYNVTVTISIGDEIDKTVAEFNKFINNSTSLNFVEKQKITTKVRENLIDHGKLAEVKKEPHKHSSSNAPSGGGNFSC